MVGGFGLVGAPLTLIDALVETSAARDLTIVSNNVGEAGRGLGKLLRQGRIRKAIASYFTSNPEAVAAAQARRAASTSCCRRARWPRRSARAAPGSAASTRRSAPARTSRRARRSGVIDGVPHVLERPLARGRRAGLRRPRRTSSATSGTGARRATSTPRWRPRPPYSAAEVGEIAAGRRPRAGGRAHAAPLRRRPGGCAVAEADVRGPHRRARRARAARRRGREPRHRHPEPDPGLPAAGHRRPPAHRERPARRRAAPDAGGARPRPHRRGQAARHGPRRARRTSTARTRSR